MITDMSNSTQILSATLWGEAEGQSLAGKAAVASVIMNRYRSTLQHPRRQFGRGTIVSTCLAAWQFSCWNAGSARRVTLLGLDFDHPTPILADCVRIAIDAERGVRTDSVHGCCFYKRFDCPWPADWGPAEKPMVLQVGAHQFFDL